MRSIKNSLDRIGKIADKQGYNFKEKTYFYGGILTGAAAPIIAGRYVFPQTDDVFKELAAWGGSVIFNSIPMALGGLPIPFYTGFFGGILGDLFAKESKNKRLNKKREEKLENLTI